jgi:hypothetical protein
MKDAKETKEPTPAKRQHKATYATDKRNGGYLIRVAGPNAAKFAGKTVPVTLKNDSEQNEMLERLIWAGKDKESGENVALYKFAPKPREMEDIPF